MQGGIVIKAHGFPRCLGGVQKRGRPLHTAVKLDIKLGNVLSPCGAFSSGFAKLDSTTSLTHASETNAQRDLNNYT